MTIHLTDQCDYYGCTRLLAGPRFDRGHHYCREHDEEFVSAGERAACGDAMPLIRFMVASYGGAEQAARDAAQETVR